MTSSLFAELLKHYLESKALHSIQLRPIEMEVHGEGQGEGPNSISSLRVEPFARTRTFAFPFHLISRLPAFMSGTAWDVSWHPVITMFKPNVLFICVWSYSILTVR